MYTMLWSSRKAWLLITTLVILWFSPFLFPPWKRGKKKRRMNSKNRDQNLCSSARSMLFIMVAIHLTISYFSLLKRVQMNRFLQWRKWSIMNIWADLRDSSLIQNPMKDIVSTQLKCKLIVHLICIKNSKTGFKYGASF